MPTLTPKPANRKRSRADLLVPTLALALVCLLTAIFLLLRYRLPAPTGPYPVGTTILNLSEPTPAGPRPIVVQLWYPAAPSRAPIAAYQRWAETKTADRLFAFLRTDSRVQAPVASAGGPFPVLLFGHRWNGERTQNTALCEDLASHGFVVAAPDHPGNSSRILLPDGTVSRGTEVMEGPRGESATAAERISTWDGALTVWVADDRFVLDQLADRNRNPFSPFHARLDTDHAGAFGHSFGGAASLALLGRDPRVLAAANLDGWTFGGLDRRTTEPILLLYEQSTLGDRERLARTGTPGTVEDQLNRADFAAIDRSLAAHGGTSLYIAGTQHLDFSDQPLLPPVHLGHFTGPIAPARIDTILRQHLLDFFSQTLQHQPPPARQPASDVTAEHWPTR